TTTLAAPHTLSLHDALPIYRCRYPIEARTAAGIRSLIESSSHQAQRPVKENVIVNDVLIVETNAAAQYGLAVALRIPGNSQLRGEISVGLLDPIAQSREYSIDCWIGRQITVGTTGVAVVTQAQADGE